MKSNSALDYALGKPRPVSALPWNAMAPDDSEIKALKEKAKRVRAKTSKFNSEEIQDALARLLDE